MRFDASQTLQSIKPAKRARHPAGFKQSRRARVAKNAKILSLAPDDSLSFAVRKLRQSKTPAAIVKDKDNILIGLITEREIFRKLMTEKIRDNDQYPNIKPYGSLTVKDAMIDTPECLESHLSKSQAFQAMRLAGYRYMPVIEQGEVIDIAGLQDLLQDLPGTSDPSRFQDRENKRDSLLGSFEKKISCASSIKVLTEPANGL